MRKGLAPSRGLDSLCPGIRVLAFYLELIRLEAAVEASAIFLLSLGTTLIFLPLELRMEILASFSR